MVEFLVEDLRFAARYPFSSKAKTIVQKLNPSLDELDSQTKEIAKGILKNALSGRPYAISNTNDKDLLQRYVLAYPVAKIMASALENQKYFFYLANSMQKATVEFLRESKRPGAANEELGAIANAFGLKFSIVHSAAKMPDLFEISLLDFLSAPSRDDSLKLVNQKVSHGKVFLEEERMIRFIAEKVRRTVLASLPVPVENIPKELKELAFEALNESLAKKKEAISASANLNALPPCIEKIYSELLAGQNIAHMERFALATFLNAIGVPEDKILEAFSHAPNYNEKITRYHISRIVKGKAGKRYAPISCAKMRSYGFCIAECNVKNPLQYYRKQIEAQKVS